MLGDKLGEFSGQSTGIRVLPSDGLPSMEATFQAQGRLLGIDTQDMGTYIASVRPDGTLYGEGQGVSTGAGGEMATWKGSGIGLMQPGGAVHYRGAVYYTTASEPWARLNKLAAIYEFNVDADGNVDGVSWEWS